MPTTKAQQKATMKYLKNNYDDLRIRIKKGNKGIIEAAAQNEGKSLNSYVVEAVNKQLISTGNPSILDTEAIDETMTRDLKGDSPILSPVEQDILSPIYTPAEPTSVPINGDNCPHCGKETIKKTDRLKIYCSTSCRANAFKKRKRAEKGGE